jgi:iron complex outermembrane receptor protein
MKINLLILLAIISNTVLGQAVLKGKITDSSTKESLVGATIWIKALNKGTSSDLDGNYKLDLNSGDYLVQFSFTGYNPIERNISLASGQTLDLNIALEPTTNDLDIVVISAGRFEQNLGEVTVSMEVIKPHIIENKNTTSVDDVLQQTPGVSIVNNEPQIRSGSGYSFGAGSRVMILVDDLPILSGDAGRPSWGFLPVENISQIEVLKGASSVLYGSAALSGVINIRTAYPTDKPQTKITAFNGLYSDPQTTEAKYWDGQPMFSGLSFLHSRKIKNLDLVIGGNLLADQSHLGPIVSFDENGDSTIADANYTDFKADRYDSDLRARINANLRYRVNKIPGLSVGINTNWLKGESLSTLLWDNSTSGLYQAYAGSATRTKQVVGNVDPFVEYITPNGSKHSIRTRWQSLDNDNDNDQGNFSDVYYGEYQFQQNFDSLGIKDFTSTFGIVGIHTDGKSQLYAGDNENGTNTADNYASYLQLDKKFGRLTASAGIRYEYFKINDDSESKPVFRAGLNYQAAEATFFRASYGQGYRFPTIAEKFIRTAVGQINIYPNTDLKSETSFNAEIGAKQGFKISKFMGYLDVACFYQEYDNFIEFTFGQWTPTISIDNLFGLGFRSLNTGKARVTGLDISLLGQGKIGNVDIQTLCGYTYSNPVSLSPDYVYGEAASEDFEYPDNTYLSSSSDTSNHILKYRLQHLVRADVQATYKKLSVGLSFRYNSYMQNIDKIFLDLDDPDANTGVKVYTGINDWRERHQKGDYIFDARISYQFNEKHKLAFIVNNMLNREYAIRPLAIEKPRASSIQYTITF